MMLLLAIAAFATDLGAWYRQGQEQQRAADVGALNGVQAYDRAVKQYFETQNVKGWDALSLDQAREAERLGFTEAVNTILALLETSGLEFTDKGSGTPASDPRNYFEESTWTAIADDGTEVVIRRYFTQTGRAIDVSVRAPGEQYFSNVVRDAPSIQRSASSVLSNCGAICENEIKIPPPFAGFNATGRGDGFGPLLFNKDGNTFNGYEEIWAVNHHVNHFRNGFYSEGEIICMDAKDRTPCKADGTQFNLNVGDEKNFQTANRPVEYINETTGIILFAARHHGDEKSGIACFNAATRSWCNTKFLPLFEAEHAPTSWGGWINITGPFVYGNKVYAFGQDGTWACATLTGSNLVANCGSGNSPAVRDASYKPMPALDAVDFHISHGEYTYDAAGNKRKELFMRMPTTGGANADQRFFCFDMSNGTPCWGGTDNVRQLDGWGDHLDKDITFLSYNQNGAQSQVCVAQMHPDTSKHQCLSLANGTLGTHLGLSIHLKKASNTWAGDAIAWQSADGTETLSFFAGGNSNKVACWDWRAKKECGILETTPDSTGSTVQQIQPYSFARVSDECIIGLSHRSVFFSFRPTTLTSCVDTTVSTPIEPCECSDNDETRWGEVRMPQELLNVTEELFATVSATPNGPGFTGLIDVDLKATNGVLDLSAIPNNVQGQVWLRLKVDAKINPGTNKPEWTEEIEADLQIVVQPTLTS